ncbi:type II secretion protein F [Microbacterium mangrovi]|uniref:Type II secretion protein F n=1 Tax=Microbacterium mangrovi TaxID=1348253 RepID=A0A0B2A769_9MICO|nr:type II secretion system F family protein [Microbacterium mangrovi]KHK97397.1 type II secretion protein F [Microbacterium mangrovi]
MIVVLGTMLAAGILLVAAPALWPRGAARPAPADRTGAVRRLLDGAGFAAVSTRTPVLLALGFAVAGACATWLVMGVPVLVLIAGVAAAGAPFVWLNARAKRLRRARRALWPDICDLLIASVRAGMGLPDAVSSLAGSAPTALRGPFDAFARDVAASGHFDSAAARLKTRLADPVADRIIETLRMARQVGGTELVPVLRSLASSVRAEAALRAEVDSRQSWIRGAAVLGVIAPWVIVALLALRPEGVNAYSSPAGVALILGGAVVSVIAYRIMIRIGRLPEPRRWFA